MNRSFPLVLGSMLLLGASDASQAADAQALYQTTCIACHGPKANGSLAGVPDFGKSKSLAKSNKVLAANVMKGFQTKGSPMAMPAKGGIATLTAAEAEALVVYMRLLVKKPAK